MWQEWLVQTVFLWSNSKDCRDPRVFCAACRLFSSREQQGFVSLMQCSGVAISTPRRWSGVDTFAATRNLGDVLPTGGMVQSSNHGLPSLMLCMRLGWCSASVWRSVSVGTRGVSLDQLGECHVSQVQQLAAGETVSCLSWRTPSSLRLQTGCVDSSCPVWALADHAPNTSSPMFTFWVTVLTRTPLHRWIFGRRSRH